MTTKSTEKITPVTETPAAPASFLELITKAGDEALAQIASAQSEFLQATEKVADDLNQPATFTVPTLGSVELTLPTAREVVEAHFALVEKYVTNQKAYADSLLNIFGV